MISWSHIVTINYLFVILMHKLPFSTATDSAGLSDRIKLSQLKLITLYKDNYTNSKRKSPSLQLKCLSHSLMCHSYGPSFVKCINKGYPEDKVNWDCKADFAKRVTFGSYRVKCEGYDGPNDQYILANSCSLEYYLDIDNFGDINKDMYETSKISNFLTLMIMMIVVLTIYKSCIKNRQAAIRRNFNETYAQIILDGAEQTIPSSIFPPPPPSYSTAIQNTSKTDYEKEDEPIVENLIENNVSRRSASPPPAYPGAASSR